MTQRKGAVTVSMKKDALPKTYVQVLESLKTRIRQSRTKAALSVNRQLVELYWHIGKVIVDRQRSDRWGKSVVERLAVDLQKAFPDMGGLSPRNIWRMRAFHLAYTEDVLKLPQPVAEIDGKNLPQPVAEIPWSHNAALLEKIKSPGEREWKAIDHGWSSGKKALRFSTTKCIIVA
jgi:predicted nuclease of restriction endonuclease-like (RecB) superfamily